MAKAKVKKSVKQPKTIILAAERKIVINRSYGRFGISEKAARRLIELGVKEPEPRAFEYRDLIHILKPDWSELTFDLECWATEHRDHPALVQTVEELGGEASSPVSELTIVAIPADVKWTIEEYDGYEKVAEVHRTWS